MIRVHILLFISVLFCHLASSNGAHMSSLKVFVFNTKHYHLRYTSVT